MSDYDAAIIGGGLAGCSAAIRLAEQGFSVALYEANAYPHHKVCGEFLSPGCTRLLDELHILETLHNVGAVPLDCAVITTQHGQQWVTPMPGALGISRYTLDSALMKQAATCGVHIHEQTTVTSIKGRLSHGFEITARTKQTRITHQARVVIGAHGKRSSIDRALNRAFLPSSHAFIGLKNHFMGITMPRRVELYTFPGGYCGMSEVENGLTNVCLLARQDMFRSAGAQIDVFIEWIQTQNPHLRARLMNAQPVHDSWLSIAQIPFAHKDPVEQDVLMVGDAAGLITPVTGDGMEIALQSGAIASQYAAAYLNGAISASELFKDYAAAWRQTFGFRLKMGRTLQAIMLRPHWITPGINLLNRLPRLGQYLVNSTRGKEKRSKYDIYSGRSHRHTG